MAGKHLVYLGRRDLLPATIDELFDPADKRQVAVPIQHPLVAGAEPTASERLLIGFPIVLVTVDHVRAPDHDLARSTGGQQPPAFIHDADVNPGAAADRPWPPWLGRQRVRGHLV